MERAVNALPWAAAISFGAGVCAIVVALWFGDVYGRDTPSAFRKIFPTMLGMNMLLWVPVALWARADRGWAVIGTVLAGVVLLLLLARPANIIDVFEFVLLAFCFGISSFPTSAMILALSGESKPIRRRISELPNARLRIGLLLLLTLVPLIAYVL
jgi:hypothetical protein